MGPHIGIDEAGRGPVLGSMFVAGIATPEPDMLPEGVADSKTVPPETRERLVDAMEADNRIDTAVIEVTVDEIDTCRSITERTARATAEIIDRLTEASSRITVDTGEADTDKYRNRIIRHSQAEYDIDVLVEADVTVPVVSAASLLAKAYREHHVDSLRATYGAIGSGYPADPTTRSFLADYVVEHGELPACARGTWQTSRDIIEASAQATVDEFIGRD